MSEPYSNCMANYPSYLPVDEKKANYSYLKELCDKYCYQYHLNKECGCYDSYLVDTEELCKYYNSTTAICKAATDRRYMRGELDCGCQQECESELFLRSLSTIAWPSSSYLPFFMAYSWRKSANEK